jgi:hypothetical protein
MDEWLIKRQIDFGAQKRDVRVDDTQRHRATWPKAFYQRFAAEDVAWFAD